MARYDYLTVNAVTEKIIGYPPLIGVSFQTTLNAAGAFSGYLPLGDPDIQASDWDASTVEARTGLYVLRDDKPLWGGLIWTRDYSSQTERVQIQGSTFESYLSHIPYVGTTHWTAADQLGIIRQIIASVGASGYTVPMPVSGNVSGILRDFDVFGFEYKWVLDIIKQLQQLPDGFDFAVDPYYDPGVGPYKQLNLGYPRRGLDQASTPYVFEYPGNVEWYSWPEDGTAFATSVVEVGAGSGPTMAVGTFGDPSLLTDGWPIMFQIVSRKDIDSPSFLNSYAAGDLALYRNPSILPVFHMRADHDPLLGTYVVGDAVRVRIMDPRFPSPGVDGYLRIHSISVTVSDDGHEDVTVTCAPIA